MLAAIYANPTFVGLVVGLPASILGWLKYRQSTRADRVAAQAGIATLEHGSVGQVLDGQNRLIENLRTYAVDTDARLVQRTADLDACQDEVDALRLDRPAR